MRQFDVLLEEALDVLLESKHKFSSTQINLSGALRRRILAFGRKIDKKDLAEDGIEDKVHVTVKYGLHTNDVDEVREAVSEARPFTLTLGKVTAFPASEKAPFDVLKIDVKGVALHRLNKKISGAIECTDTHPEYNPHITIAYLKPGASEKYVGSDVFDGEKVKVDTIMFSDRDRHMTKIVLGK